MKKLTEHEAKELLGRYGVPVTSSRIASTVEEAIHAVKALSGPAAIKIASSKIPHKAQMGGVRLGVTLESAREAYHEVLDAAKRLVRTDDIAGVLIEPMLPSGIELIIGAIRDPYFGPVVMIGEGGSGVEDRARVEFSLCPLSEEDARRLVAALPIAVGFSETALKRVVDILVRIGGVNGVLFSEPVVELDINPLIVGPESATAVDAYAVLSEGCNAERGWEAPEVEDRKSLYKSIRATFEPQGIVVVGASAKPGKLGFSVIQNLIEYGYHGPIYAIHPKANNIYGCQAYPSVSEIPTEVDRAIVIVPANAVVSSLRDCARKGVRVAQVYSAGFSEWSDEGKQLEREIQSLAASSDIRVIGPNTIGTFSAPGRLTLTAPRYSPEGAGNIAFVGQSGTYALDVISRSKAFGLPLAYSLSCGNCVDLKPVDFLAYLAEDPAISLIAMYLESMEGAGSFFRLAQSISKPVVLLKGGRTTAGLVAATSHTGAMASDMGLWEAAARQAGTVVVQDINQLMDVLVGFSAFNGKVPGRRLGLFTSGGGISVGAADTAATAGLSMAELTKETRAALSSFGVPGTSIQNPVDIPVWGLKSGDDFIFDSMIRILADDPGVDTVIACVEMGSVFSFSRDEAAGVREMRLIVDSIARARSTKPLSAVLRTTGDKVQDDIVRDSRSRLWEKGVAVYASVEAAIRANAAIACAQVPRSGASALQDC